MIVVGVDPGCDATGFGVVERRGNRYLALEWGVASSGGAPTLGSRLRLIHEALLQVMLSHRPDFAAVENVFHARNARSSLMLGHARGVVLLTAEMAGVPSVSYTPLEIKKAVVGYGRASKEQVQGMVRLLLGLKDAEMALDASDALAAALCHLQTYSVGRTVVDR